ncbi:hypothetical protein HK102_003205 [Quaeritorhiza haematococci]|nr:hypothetical protein HK102_003205 [Quaeritorhiza haematococci]
MRSLFDLKCLEGVHPARASIINASLPFQVILQVVEAINTIYNANATSDQRKYAQEYTESIKESTVSPTLGHFLAHKNNNQSEVVRYFGLALLEHSVKYKWANLQPAERDQTREAVVDLLKNGTYDILVERPFIKEKLAKLVVEVAKRMWPLQWPDMDALLRELYVSSPISQELVLIIYRSLAEDIFIYDDAIASMRNKELTTAMFSVVCSARVLTDAHQGAQEQARGSRADFDAIINFIRSDPENEGWLNRWSRAVVELYKEWEREVQRGNVEASSIAERLTTATLNTLGVMLDWVILRAIVESGLQYRLVDLVLSDSKGVRLAAAECLLVLFSRQISHQDENRTLLIWNPIFAENNMEKLVIAWARAHGRAIVTGIDTVEQWNVIPEDDYPYVKRLAQALVALGENHICFKRNTSTPPMFYRYLEQLLVIMDHPSILLSSTTASFWTEALKHEYVGATAEIIQVMPNLLEQAALRIMKVDGADLNAAVDYYKEIDFDSTAEFVTYANAYRQRMLDLIKPITNAKPLATFLWVSERTQATLSSVPSSSDLNDLGFCKTNSPYFKSFDVTTTLLTTIVGALPKNQDSTEDVALQEQLVPTLVQLMRFVVEFETKMFGMVSYTMPDEQNFIERRVFLRSETKILRAKATGSLTKLAIAMPDVFMGIYQDVLNTVRRLIENGLVTSREKILLLELLVTIVFFSNVPMEQKRSFIDSVVEPVFRDWGNLPVSASMSSTPAAFLRFLGTDSLVQHGELLNRPNAILRTTHPSLIEGLESLRTERSKVFTGANAVVTFLRRTADIKDPKNNEASGYREIWGPYIQQILPNCLLCVRAIHSLWDSSQWESLPPAFTSVLDMSPAERAAVLATALDQPDDDSAKSGTELDDQLDSIRTWLANLRSACYSIISLMSYLDGDFYGFPSLSGWLVENLFAYAEFIDNRHWKAMIDIHSTKIFLTFLSNIEKMEDVTEEIVREKVLRDLTRTLADLYHWFFATDNSKAFVNVQLIDFLFSTPSIVEPFLSSFTALMNYKDTQSSRKMLTISLRIIPALVRFPAFYPFLGQTLLVSTLEVLHDPYHTDLHSECFHVIAEVFLALKDVSNSARETFLSVPGMTREALQQFEQQITEKASQKEQVAVVRNFLRNITGLEVSKWGTKAEKLQFVLNIHEKALLSKPPRDSNRNDVTDSDERANLEELFSGH